MLVEEDYLPISAIQHFAFCERQWGLLYVEKLWLNNSLTQEGTLLHERVDDPYFAESRGQVRVVRSVALCSSRLGLYGMADLIEIHRLGNAPLGHAYHIVEYKRGRPKANDCDQVQLCAQAMCLEEMLNLSLGMGHLYYGQTKRRQEVELTAALRVKVVDLCVQMHQLYRQGITPKADLKRGCSNCSMESLCLPKLTKSSKKAEQYMATFLAEFAEL
ncbi:MAG: hypothetical protein DDT34_01543 [Firmicutes bacterium]|nr:hypothetical protein [Bacillota bacterium]MBT9157921.1 hypothetical protein [Bacillota bacterium]